MRPQAPEASLGAWSRPAARPLAVFKNGLRIVALCLLTLYVDTGFMEGSLHTKGGAVFFGLALVMLVPIFWSLRKLESRQAD